MEIAIANNITQQQHPLSSKATELRIRMLSTSFDENINPLM